jgi:DNA polymerase II large subunit
LSQGLEPALELASRYNLSVYLRQCLELTKKQIESAFWKGERETRRISKVVLNHQL